MAKSIKIRAKNKDGVTTVKALMDHPMETGSRKDGDGNKIPANFIQEVVCKLGEKVLITALWSGGVSKNPYLSFKFDGGNPGDVLTLLSNDSATIRLPLIRMSAIRATIFNTMPRTPASSTSRLVPCPITTSGMACSRTKRATSATWCGVSGSTSRSAGPPIFQLA